MFPCVPGIAVSPVTRWSVHGGLWSSGGEAYNAAMPTRSLPAAGVVLAAGTSTRMGTNKLLLDLEGASLLRRVATRALDAGLDPVVVVLGHDAEPARRQLDGLPVRIAASAGYREGIATSLRAGIAALPADTPAAVMLLADMPLVTSDMIRTVANCYRERTARIVVSDYEGIIAPPVLYHRAFFPELASLTGENAGREVVRRHSDEVQAVRWPRALLQDIDLPGDYERLRPGP